MPKRRSTKTVETIRHDEASRKNIPTAEFRSVMDRSEQNPVQVAYQRRNRDLDPQLVWRGKDAQDWSDLVVQAPPLFIQEKVHPKVLIDDLRRQRRNGPAGQGDGGTELQPDLFADFNGLPSDDARTEFYQHDANWSNRMILGDSLQVMASLAEREGLRGKVQCIYLDPPYGIKFNSNFQWSTTSRDVKDGKAEHISREPEQVKAFRDTWRDGMGAALLRRGVFALFMGLFARGCVSPVLSSGGQQPSQHVPASFRRPAEPRNGTEYRRSVPLGRAPFWTFARRSGTVPWAGGQTCDGCDDRIPGT